MSRAHRLGAWAIITVLAAACGATAGTGSPPPGTAASLGATSALATAAPTAEATPSASPTEERSEGAPLVATDDQIREVVAAIDDLSDLIDQGATGDDTGNWANETATNLLLQDAILADPRLSDFRDTMLELLDEVGSGADQTLTVVTLLVMRDDIAGLVSMAPTPTATPKPTATPAPQKITYATLTKRQWQKLVKNPDAHLFDTYKVWACISQFDSATGDDTFRGQASYKNLAYWYSDGDNAFFTGDADQLADFVQGDIVAMSVTDGGSYSYETTLGGNITVPIFYVDKIKRLKGSC